MLKTRRVKDIYYLTESVDRLRYIGPDRTSHTLSGLCFFGDQMKTILIKSQEELDALPHSFGVMIKDILMLIYFILIFIMTGIIAYHVPLDF